MAGVLSDAWTVCRDSPGVSIERVRLSFYVNEYTAETPTDTPTVHTGSLLVSSREATVVDLVREQRASGGISNVATIRRDRGA